MFQAIPLTVCCERPVGARVEAQTREEAKGVVPAAGAGLAQGCREGLVRTSGILDLFEGGANGIFNRMDFAGWMRDKEK